MNIKDIVIRKGDSKNSINSKIGEWLFLEDDTYLGNSYNHNWRCKCNKTFTRTWSKIKSRESINCSECRNDKTELRYKTEVKSIDGYEYIRSYRKSDILPCGRVVGDYPYIEIRHKYCNSVYIIKASSFINEKRRCGQCCGSYEKSIAFYIKEELIIDLEKIWDYEKNDKLPHTVSKYTHDPIYLKCLNDELHESYEISANNFVRAATKNNTLGCPFCHGKKVCISNSFARYYLDKLGESFLSKYWDWEKNEISPWEITPSSNINKVWIKCQKKEYHGSYLIECNEFSRSVKNNNTGCKYCSKTKVHVYDSFGYNHFDKVLSWHPDNNISPFKVSLSNANEYKFICPECNRPFSRVMSSVTRRNSIYCTICISSKGERKIRNWLENHNLIFHYNEGYFNNLTSKKGRVLRPDFIVPNLRLWIEYDGEFHFENKYDEESFLMQQSNDRIKDDYAKKNNWTLIRIPYWEFDNIESILENLLSNM